MKTNYKKKYQETKIRLEAIQMIGNHTKSYIHISYKTICLFFTFLGSVALTVWNFIAVFIPNWNILHIAELFETSEEINTALTGVYQFGIIPQILFQCCLLGLCFVCLVALIKGGFEKLKKWDDPNGLIAGMIGGMIGGMIVGMIVGIIAGIIAEFE